MLTQPKTETLRKSLSTSILTTGEKNNILNKASKNPFHTCTAPSPPPARPFSERNIYCYFRHHRHCQYLKSSFNVLLLAFWIFVSIGFCVEQVGSTSRYAVWRQLAGQTAVTLQSTVSNGLAWQIGTDQTRLNQTWDLSNNLHGRIFEPKILHTKGA